MGIPYSLNKKQKYFKLKLFFESNQIWTPLHQSSYRCIVNCLTTFFQIIYIMNWKISKFFDNNDYWWSSIFWIAYNGDISLLTEIIKDTIDKDEITHQMRTSTREKKQKLSSLYICKGVREKHKLEKNMRRNREAWSRWFNEICLHSRWWRWWWWWWWQHLAPRCEIVNM